MLLSIRDLYNSRYMQMFDLSVHFNVANRRSDFNKFGALEYIHALLDAYIFEIPLCKFTFSYECSAYRSGKCVIICFYSLDFY